jgi:hypothetical protein
MKHKLIPIVLTGLFTPAAFAGTETAAIAPITPAAPEADAFSNIRRPITNPTLFDLALPSTNVHPIIAYHRLPDTIETQGGQLALGGDVELYALQFEIALNEQLSLVAVKDGYVRFNPDNPAFTSSNGFANLGAGVKYAFYVDPAAGTALSSTLTFELPTGNSDVFQGEGKGLANLIINGLQMVDAWQFAGSLGFQIPFSNEQSTMGFLSAHVSYEVNRWFIPLVELNWFHVIDAGDGTGNYFDQLGGAVPAAINFEGGDLFNLGAVNAGRNRDLVTAAVGFRSRITDNSELGFAYEMPLTDDSASLMEDRFTLDYVWRF